MESTSKRIYIIGHLDLECLFLVLKQGGQLKRCVNLLMQVLQKSGVEWMESTSASSSTSPLCMLVMVN